LKMSEIKVFRNYFETVEFDTAWLFTLWIFIRYYLSGIDPNAERYWKKILHDHKKLEKTYCPLEKLDAFVLKILPFLKRYCWNIVVFAKK
jgi:hypothetical protein